MHRQLLLAAVVGVVGTVGVPGWADELPVPPEPVAALNGTDAETAAIEVRPASAVVAAAPVPVAFPGYYALYTPHVVGWPYTHYFAFPTVAAWGVYPYVYYPYAFYYPYLWPVAGYVSYPFVTAWPVGVYSPWPQVAAHPVGVYTPYVWPY
jgi:hypothetical protein